MNLKNITASQKRALSVILVILLLIAAWFLRQYLVIVVTAGIMAYLFSPLYRKFTKRMGKGAAATLTFLAAAAIVIVPLSLVIAIAGVQIGSMVSGFISNIQGANLTEAGNQALRTANDLLDRVPYTDINITQQDIISALSTGIQAVGNWLPGFLQSAASSFLAGITAAVIFIYLFFSMLVKQDKIIAIFKNLNPVGDEVSDMYLAKTGAMVKATVRGQFIIALMQGLSGVLSIYIAGFHEAVFILFILFTILSLIPLGSGILAIPFGIGLMAFGNISGGLIVIVWHLLVTNTIDNIMRPILVPKSAQLDPALVMLSVFAGISLFGLLGIVIGPVFMILVTTTIDVYRAVNYGVPLDKPEDDKQKQGRFKKLFSKFRRQTT